MRSLAAAADERGEHARWVGAREVPRALGGHGARLVVGPGLRSGEQHLEQARHRCLGQQELLLLLRSLRGRGGGGGGNVDDGLVQRAQQQVGPARRRRGLEVPGLDVDGGELGHGGLGGRGDAVSDPGEQLAAGLVRSLSRPCRREHGRRRRRRPRLREPRRLRGRARRWRIPMPCGPPGPP